MPVPRHLDHLVYATRDLDATCADLERRLGVRASEGGRHVGRGTRNALIAIGSSAYLEIVGPDPQQPAPPVPRWFTIDELAAPRLVTWALATTSLREIVARAAKKGVTLGDVADGGRRTPDGRYLRWQYTDPTVMLADGVLPFLIDWGSTPHPSVSAARGPRLVRLRAQHPNPEEVRRALSVLGIDMNVDYGKTPALIATFDAPAGPVELE